jgi:N-formylglutamate amidohydrolase
VKTRTLLALLLGALPAGRAQEPAPEPRFGQRRLIEYQPGELPLILAAPHGGREKPADLPDRREGVLTMDANTQELARAVAAAVAARCGARPHLVICHLHRSKLDANRDVAEAAQGSAAAEQAWHEHHGFIEQACRAAVDRHGWAFLIDLHGHSHPQAQVELGWLHDAAELARPEPLLNTAAFVSRGSAELLARRSPLPYSEFLRGPASLGALLENQGFPATPSPRLPVPIPPYFRGGYTLVRHCAAERGVAGVQIEANRSRLRDTEANRQRFAEALATALTRFLPGNLQARDPHQPGTDQK